MGFIKMTMTMTMMTMIVRMIMMVVIFVRISPLSRCQKGVTGPGISLFVWRNAWGARGILAQGAAGAGREAMRICSRFQWYL